MTFRQSHNIYNLPFLGAINICPAPSHYKQRHKINAIDFALNIGEEILAAQNGLVVKVIDGHSKDAHTEQYANKCNLIVIEHQNNEYSAYLHLKKGIIVKEDQEVKIGQLIAHSGLSGYTSYPHLHFEVMLKHDKKEYSEWRTIPTRFNINKKIIALVSPEK